MYLYSTNLNERKVREHPTIPVTTLLTTLLVSSLIVLSSCGNQSNAGTPGNTPASPSSSSKSTTALRSIHMIDETTGWAMTQNAVLRTSDGGLHWKDLTPAHHPLISEIDAHFLTASDAWVSMSPATSPTTLVFHTGDGGQTWQKSTVPTDRSSHVQINAVDAQHGWLMNHMVGGGAQAELVEIFRTSDGGKTWEMVTRVYPASTDGPPPGRLPYGGSKSGLSFINASTGWVSGSVPVNNHTWFFVTHDGGSTWHQQALPPLPQGTSAFLSLLSPTFFTANDGILPVYLSADDKASGFGLYVTHDGGTTWNNIATTQPPSSIAVVDFIDTNHGWATSGPSHGSGKAAISPLFITNDGGQHWVQLPASQIFREVNSLDFVSGTVGWAIGHDDTGPLLLKTVDGGSTWTKIDYSIT